MRLVNATYVNNEVEPGWLLIDEAIPLGKRYRVDLDSVRPMILTNRRLGRVRLVDCVLVVSPGPSGFLPLLALKIEADA